MILDAVLRVAGVLAATSWNGTHPGDPKLAKMLGVGGKTQAGVRVDAESALGLAAFWRGTSILSNILGKMPANCYERTGDDGGRARDREHAADLFLRKRPGIGLRPFGWKRTLQSHALRHGNGFAYLFRDEAARPIGSTILDPSRTFVTRTLEEINGIPAGAKVYLTHVRGQDRYLKDEDVIHIHGLGFDGLCGYPPVEVLSEALGLGLAAQQFGARFFGKGANPSGFIKYPGKLSEEAAERLKTSFEKNHSGLPNSHGVIVLEEDGEFTPTTVEPEKAQFLGTREFSLREVANILGIQSHKLGDQSRKSYASLEQSNQEHLDDDVDPWLVQWEEELSEKLLTEREKREDTHFIEFDRKALLKMDATGRANLYANGRNLGWLTINDICRRENMPSIGPLGDTRMVPANMVPLDQMQQVFEAQAAKKATPAKSKRTTKPAAASAEPSEDPKFLALVEANLAAIRERIEKQAEAKRKKGPAEYSAWLEALDEAQGPPELHPYSVPLMRSLKESLK